MVRDNQPTGLISPGPAWVHSSLRVSDLAQVNLSVTCVLELMIYKIKHLFEAFLSKRSLAFFFFTMGFHHLTQRQQSRGRLAAMKWKSVRALAEGETFNGTVSSSLNHVPSWKARSEISRGHIKWIFLNGGSRRVKA